MKKLKFLSLFIITVVLGSSVAMAQNMGMQSYMRSDSSANLGMMGPNRMGYMNHMYQNGMMGMMHGGMMGGMMGMMRGYMQSMMNRPANRMMMSLYVLPSMKSLGLSSSQKSKLNTLQSDYMKTMQDSRNKLFSLQNKLSAQLSSKSRNLKNIRKLISQKAVLQGNRQWMSVETYHKMMGVLTQDQQKKWNGMDGQTLMISMMNNMSVNQMFALCQAQGGMGMMNGMMGGMMNMMHGYNHHSMMN